MAFRWDRFLANVIPEIGNTIGKEFAYNQYNDALAKMVAGYEKIANENAQIINPALAVGTGTFDPNAPVYDIIPNPNKDKTPISRQGVINPNAEVGTRPVQKTDLSKFYSMAMEEIAKLQANPYDKGVYSNRLNDMYTKLTTKEKVDKVFDTTVDKNGNVWRTNLVTGDMQLISKGVPKPEEDVLDGQSFYSTETVDGVQKYFYTEYKNGQPIKKEIPYELYKNKYEDKQKTKNSSLRGPSGPKKKKDKFEDNPDNINAEGSTPTGETWTWTSKKTGKQYTLGPVAQQYIPDDIEAIFDRASKNNEIDKMYNHYMSQYKAMKLDDQTLQEITNWFDELYDLYYPKTNNQGKAK